MPAWLDIFCETVVVSPEIVIQVASSGFRIEKGEVA
jgi:hypothetical protein